MSGSCKDLFIEINKAKPWPIGYFITVMVIIFLIGYAFIDIIDNIYCSINKNINKFKKTTK